MPDAFHKVRTGEPLRIPAMAYNAFIDAARYVRQQEQDQTGDRVGLNLRRIRIKNTTRDELPRFGVLAIDEPLIDPEDNLNGFRNTIAFSGVRPDKTQHLGRFAILLEPALQDKIVLAVATGVCPVKIDVVSDDHQYADIKDEATDTLQSSHFGSARILWKQTGVGTKWAVVALAMPAPLIVPGKITAVEGDGTDANATYDAEAFEGMGPPLSVAGVTPVNRPFGDSDIEPAAVGDDCLLYTSEDGAGVQLIQLTETARFDACDEEPGAGGSFVAERKSNTVTGSGVQNLFRAVIPSGVLGTSKGVRFAAVIRRTIGDDGATYTLKYGGATLLTLGAIKHEALMLTGMVWADGDANAQRGNLGSSLADYAHGSSSVDSTLPQDLDIDIELQTATDEWKADWFSVEAF